MTEVVIVTYNRLALLQECVDAVVRQTVPFSKIIIVDNASTDGTKEYLKSLESDSLYQIIYEDEYLGGAGGFYDGLAVAKQDAPDYVLLIDDDAILRVNYMEQLLQYATKHPDHAALAGTVMTDGVIDTNQRRRLGSKLLFLEHRISEDAYRHDSFPCDMATFCGMLINGRALQQIGLPRKSYFLWYDDSEYSLRLGEFQSRRYPGLEENFYNRDSKKKGYAGIMVIPSAVLDHKTHLPKKEKGLLSRTTWRQYYGYRNRLDTAKQHFGMLSSICISLEYTLLIFLSILQLFVPSKREHARFNIDMIREARNHGIEGKLGFNEKYQAK